MNKYDPKIIEPKWQKKWDDDQTYHVEMDSTKEKFFGLVEFPYPSGAGLHVGHPRSYTAMDVITRKKRMEGKNVLYPIGFDSFGLPTENFAIKTGRPPAEITTENIATFTRQLKSLGYGFDWSRSVTTSEPEYYKWTQWIFLQLYKHGLAYKANQPINWCPKDKIGLANEEVVDGCCERCGTAVEKRNKEQWMLAITKYADKLLAGLNEVDYITRAKIQQENWIGRSEGINWQQKIKDLNISIEAYDSVPQTFMAQTFAVIAPEHPLVIELVKGTEYEKTVLEFVEDIKRKKLDKKFEMDKSMEGIFTGRCIDNPFGTGDLPIWVASFVVMDYGSGIVNCSAHDERDFAFAKKYNIPLRAVMLPPDPEQAEQVKNLEVCYHHDPEAVMEFPAEFKGRKWGEAREEIIDFAVAKGFGVRKVNYKLRDWVFSRQRYWGEPIPLVFCENCKNKKYNFIIVHGLGSNSSSGFKPWLKIELEKVGHTVWNPDLPNTDAPSVDEQADFILQNTPFEINEDTVLVGHSLGALVVNKVLEKINKKIAKVIFVDPVYKPEFNDSKRSAVEDCCDFVFDWEKIRARAEKFIILGDNSFPIIKREHLEELTKKVDGNLFLSKPSYPHFSNNGGAVIQEPAILEACSNSAWIPLPVDQLPLTLPKVEKYLPTDNGESPLAPMADWVNTTCPQCGGSARRETDTMPNWAGSSWYWLRYADPHNAEQFAAPDKLKYWEPVDWYNGGMEHTVLHLLYSRFWNQFLYDIGVVPTLEPYKKRTSHGMILASDGQKMSKSLGNVINPDEMVEKFGADALRTYILFMGPFDQVVAWDTNGLVGVSRFLERVWNLQEKINKEGTSLRPDGATARQVKNNKIQTLLHQTIKKISDDIENMRFNTAVAKLMELSNEMSKEESIALEYYQTFIKLLAPFAPHIGEELWSQFGTGGSVAYASWPKYDAELARDNEITVVAQVNGKVRAEFTVSPDISEDEMKAMVLSHENVQKWLEGKEPKKVIYVKGKLVSVVV